jgi:hypothetical protein
MAPEKPPEAQKGAPKEAVLRDGLLGIGGAGRVVPATGAEEGGENQLVQPDQEERDGFHDDIRFRKIVVNDEK